MNETIESREIASMSVESGTVALLNKSEIDMQVATAHRYPRSIKRFRDEALQMVTLTEQVAQECIYSLPRKEKDQATGQWVIKPIEGPSARFGEVVASAWGNCRAGARIVNDQGDFVTAQGVFHDLERNVAITYEVQRRITDKNGNRFKADMIGVTANAACSIALRNAILKGVPKAFWSDIYDSARQAAIGNVQTLGARRSRALAVLQKMGVHQETVFAFLKIAGIEDITLEHLSTLFGITTALKDGEITPEQAFDTSGSSNGAGAAPVPVSEAAASRGKPPCTPEHFAKNLAGWTAAIQGGKSPDDVIKTVESRYSLSDEQKAQLRAVAPGAAQNNGEMSAEEIAAALARERAEAAE